MMLCKFPHVIHKWSSWKVVSESDWMVRTSYRGAPVPGSERRVGVTITQKRTCSCCGYTQVKTNKVKS